MTPESCRAMARYNRWMNGKVYAAAALLGDDERKRDRGAFFKSIHRTLNHLMVGDSVWLSRLTGVVAPAGFMAPGIRALDQELFFNFDELRAEREKIDAAIASWAASVTPEVLGGTLRYGRDGQRREYPCWWAVIQLFNHETHHRGQITTLLSQAGQDPGSTDILAMLLEEAQVVGSAQTKL
jgi:uncharacterized damage-inducible protein DinB